MLRRLYRSDAVRHGAFVFCGIALANVFNYLYFMLLGRRIGVEPYGVVTSLASALLVFAAPAIVAQLVVARLAADLHARGDDAALRQLADRVSQAALIAASCVALTGCFFRDQLAWYFNLPSAQPIVVALLGLAIFSVVTVQRGVFQGAQRFGDLGASYAIEAILKTVVGVSLSGALGATGALLGIVVGSGCTAVVHQVLFRKRFGETRSPIALPTGLIRRVTFGVGLGQITLTVLTYYDVPLIKHIFDPRSAGLYAAAALVGRAVVSAVSFVPTLIMPKATARAAAGLSSLSLLGIALLVGGGIVAIAFGVTAIAPRLVVTLVAGNAFASAASLVVFYVLASGALSLANISTAYKMGIHKFDFVFPTLIVAVGEIAVLSFWHPTLRAAVEVLLAGHVGVFVVSLLRFDLRSSAFAIPKVANDSAYPPHIDTPALGTVHPVNSPIPQPHD